MKKKLFSLVALGALMLGGCAVKNPEKVVTPLTLPDPAAPIAVQEERVDQFRDLTRNYPMCGVWLYIGAYDKVVSRETVLDYVEDFRFNHIYCLITSETELDEDLEKLLIAAQRRNLPVDIVMDIFSFYPRKSGNRFLRSMRDTSPGIQEMVNRILELRQNNDAYRNLAGITIVCNVDFFNRNNVDLPADLLFVWDEDTFGPGLDNDLMMREVLKRIHDLPAFPDGLKLTLAVPDIFNEYVREGKLSCGAIGDFASTRVPQPDIIIISRGNKPTEIVKRVEDELEDPRLRPGSVSVMQAIANHTSVGDGQTRRRDWADLIHVSKYLQEKCVGKRNFGGLILGPLVIVKILQMEP